MRNELVFISGKYSAPTREGVQENIEVAKRYLKKYILLGYPVICPHTNTAFLGGTAPYDFFVNMYLEILERCDIVVMIPGWKESYGAKKEEAMARLLNKKIIYEEE